MSSGWFDCTKPTLPTSLQGKQGLQGAHARVRGGSSAPRTFSNHFRTELAGRVEGFHRSSGWFDCTEPSRTTSFQVCRLLMHKFGVVQAYRSSSNLLEPHQRRDSKVCIVLSHEFGVVRLYRTFSTYIVAGFAGCLCTSSGASNLLEPSRTTSSQR